MKLMTAIQTMTVAATAGCAVLALAVPAAAEPFSTNVHMVAICTSNDQNCPVQTARLDGGGSDVKVAFRADSGHCSNIEVNVSVDGRTVASGVAGPGGIVSSRPFPLSAGTHAFAVEGIGRVGGCNTGKLGSWEGDLTFTELIPDRAPAAKPQAPAPASAARDTDGDGLSDSDEVKFFTNVLLGDTDFDGVGDGDEIKNRTNPVNALSN